MLGWVPSEGSLAQILLSDWAPGIIALMIGGLLANTLYPRWQFRIQQLRDKEKRKREICESIATNFQVYLANLSRLHSFAKVVEREQSDTDGVPEGENIFARQQVYVQKRDDSSDALNIDFSMARLYFSDTALTEIDDFLRWKRRWSPEKRDDGTFDFEPMKAMEKKIVQRLKEEL